MDVNVYKVELNAEEGGTEKESNADSTISLLKSLTGSNSGFEVVFVVAESMQDALDTAAESYKGRKISGIHAQMDTFLLGNKFAKELQKGNVPSKLKK